MVGVNVGFIDDTSAASSISLVHTTGLPATYNHEQAETPSPTDLPLLSSLPLPCHVTCSYNEYRVSGIDEKSSYAFNNVKYYFDPN